MRIVPDAMADTWESGDFTGDMRPFARVTIQRPMMALNKLGQQLYATLPYQQADVPRELPNVKSISWERSVDVEAATCTIVLFNTTPLPPGTHPEGGGVLDLPGWYTYNRGATSYSASWGHAANKWQDWIVPDRVLRTYQGYGWDSTAIPELDTHLVCTGTWLIDDVDYSVEGLVQITCRDYARLLLDQILYPPVVPLVKYPLSFDAYHSVANPATSTVRTATGFTTPTYMTSSNFPYFADGPVHGHSPHHAFDASASTYWLSVGNQHNADGYSYEFIQGSLANETVKGFKFQVWGGPYRVYIGVRVGGVWQGTRTVPYDPNNPISSPNGSNVKYVTAVSVGYEEVFTHMFKNATNGYANVDAVRITLTHLYNSKIGPYVYRAGVRTFQVSTTGTSTVTAGGGSSTQGNYGDYADIIRLLLAYGGFYWPANTTKCYVTRSDGVKVVNIPTNNAYLGSGASGNVWADVEDTYTSGVVPLGTAGGVAADVFDKKPIMEAINYIRDMVGYIFYVDENGGAIFRVPNIWTVGNYVGDSGHRASRTTDLYTIDESKTILGLKSKLTSRSVRETIFVGNLAGKIAAVSHGYNPYPAGLRRTGGWTDQNFETKEQCQIMADLITVRAMFNYRSNSLQIPAFPAIQIDDQVRIVERITGEAYIHYIKSIASNWDMMTGEWTYDLTTHWLGEDPATRWFIDPATLAAETRAFLQTLGKIA